MTDMALSVEHYGRTNSGEDSSSLAAPLTPTAGAGSMWGAPTATAGKFQVEMDEGGWMHTYHATIYAAPNGQRVQFRTSAVNNGPVIESWPVSTSANDTQPAPTAQQRQHSSY